MAAPLSRSSSTAYREGLNHAREGSWSEAIAALERALRAQPNDPAILLALGETASAMEMNDAAIGFLTRVLALDPSRVEAIAKLASLYVRSQRVDEAQGLLSDALITAPEEASLWHAIGLVRRAAGDNPNAETFFREALRLKPRFPEALGNLADVRFDLGAREEALELLNRALRQKPDHPQLHLTRALYRLEAGDLRGGWDDYEWRLKVPGQRLARDHGLPRWTGGAHNNRRLLVCAEQGIGDQMLFASCLPDLAAAGPVIAECEPRLVPLFARSFPGIAVHAAQIETDGGQRCVTYPWLKEAGGAALAIELASLPRHLRATRDAFPDRPAYLVADDGEGDRWRRWLGALGAAPRIGMCWRSGKLSGARALQFAPLAEWGAFLGRVPGTLVVLQYDAQADEIAALEKASGRPLAVPPGLDQKNEIDRTAALIASLDAVVTAPTAVASLSGALGVPTLKILYDTTWTALGATREPLQPRVSLIRPARPGDWRETFAAAARELKTRF